MTTWTDQISHPKVSIMNIENVILISYEPKEHPGAT